MIPIKKKSVNILAIDPGPTQSGYVIWDGHNIVGHDYIYNIHLRDNDLIPNPNIDFLAIEMIASYGMPVGKETFETCLEIGKIMQYWDTTPCYLIYRKDIKIHFCGSMKAKDSNIRQALIDRIGPQGTKKNHGPTYGIKSHTWSALAIAVYAWDTIVNDKK